jgi:hypothetical protein
MVKVLENGQLFFSKCFLHNIRCYRNGTTDGIHFSSLNLVGVVRVSRQRSLILGQIGDSKEHVYNRLFDYSPLTVNQQATESAGSESIVSRCGLVPGLSQGVRSDYGFSELLHLVNARITLLMTGRDNAKGGNVELKGFYRQVISLRDLAVGSLMSTLCRARH